MPSKLSWDDLSSLEKVAALELIAEAKDLLAATKFKTISLEDWLSQLRDGIKLAMQDYVKCKSKE